MKKEPFFQAEITVDYIPKQVVIFKEGDKLSSGSVGNYKFYWDSKKYAAPRVTLSGTTYQNGHGACIMVRNYLEAAKKEILRPRNPSPMPINSTPIKEREDNSISASECHENYISGCSKWLRKYKKWTPCRMANGATYMRRTHFDFTIPGAQELVTKYLNYCSKCHERTVCESPCDNPEVRSSENHFE